MEFKVGFGTDIGKKRSQNQDHGAAVPEIGLFTVSDGMGGHKGGETASATATDVILDFVRNVDRTEPWDAAKVLQSAIQAANEAIYKKSLEEPKLRGMGTTTTALLFQESSAIIGHVGDSRCYFLRPHHLWQLTRDHSLVQEKLRAGMISRDQLRTDRMKNVITRSVGFEREIEVELYYMKVQPGDCFLLCSDGLSGAMEDSDIQRIVQSNFFEQGDLDQTVKKLIDEANGRGGDDNITVLVVQVTAL